MNKELLDRMRVIWHVTSLTAAESIVKSKIITTKDPDGASNFHPNQVSSNYTDSTPEVSLGFYWHGDIDFKDFSDGTEIQENTLSVYVTNGLNDLSVETIKIWASKLKNIGDDNLELCDIAIFSDFKEKADKDANLENRYEKLKKACKDKVFIKTN